MARSNDIRGPVEGTKSTDDPRRCLEENSASNDPGGSLTGTNGSSDDSSRQERIAGKFNEETNSSEDEASFKV
jgi:hypothetical protein